MQSLSYLSVPPVSTAPSDQIEESENFDIATFISHEHLFLPIELPIPLEDEDLDRADSHRFIATENAALDNDADADENENGEELTPQEFEGEDQGAASSESVECPLPSLKGHSTSLDTKELVGRLNIECSGYGYAIVIARSRLDKNTCDLRCDRGGAYRNTHKLSENDRRRRHTNTRANNCPFLLKGKRKGEMWEINITNPTHNHPLSRDPRAHPMHRLRALDVDARNFIMQMLKAAVAPRIICSTLLERFGRCPIMPRDIYNIHVQLIQKELRGRTPIQALLDEITPDDAAVIARWQKDSENRITHLLLFSKKSLEILRDNHDILLLDCTYKTNRYRLPLLNILCVTKLHTTVNVGVVFMNRETEWDYM
jgi:MULE transposase domain